MGTSFTKRVALLLGPMIVFGWSGLGSAQGPREESDPAVSAAGEPPVPTSPGPAPPGTVVTMQNWQQYKQYLSQLERVYMRRWCGARGLPLLLILSIALH